MTNTTAPQRLDRLEAYLQEDPDNLTLRAEAFDAALQGGDWVRAEFHLRLAQALSSERALWRLREGQWLLAQQRFADADDFLRRLVKADSMPEPLKPVLAHDLAYAAMRQGKHAEGLRDLQPWVEGDATRPVDAALQVLWLRLMHRAGQLDEAMTWVRGRWQARQLAAPAAGVASLIALDAEDVTACLLWSDHALKEHGGPLEALVARASAALAQKDPPLARSLLTSALQHNPTDGRAWSALAFTDLMEQKLEAARSSFGQAVQLVPQHIGTWHGLGWTCVLQGDLDAALQAFQQAVDLDRNFGESHGGLAVVQALRGERTAAELSIARATGLDANSLSARYAQAVLSGEAGDVQAMRRLATRLLGNRPAPLGGSVLDMLPQAAEAPATAAPHDLN